MTKEALILLSGGLDSATCLAKYQADGWRLHALSFDYGQRHQAELTAAKRLAAHYQVASHRVIPLALSDLGGSALTDASIPVPEELDVENSSIPVTYVPARNTLFLAYALAAAEVQQVSDIVIGVNAVDYSGYPDCRPEFIAAFEKMANLATKMGVEGQLTRIHTPLIELTKAEIIQLGVSCGLDYGMTVSCYQSDERGAACGVCDSCRFRRQGFEEAEVSDPTVYQS